MSLTPLKTQEELLFKYGNDCRHCEHERDQHDEAGITAMYYCRGNHRLGWVSLDEVCHCPAYEPLTPLEISVKIEEYYVGYEEHKRLVNR